MSVTMEQVVSLLNADEIDYPEAARIGPEALEHLAVLIDSEDDLLASKATYLASLIEDERRIELLEKARESEHATVRLAAVVGANALPAEPAERIVADLLADDDVGVRKQAILSATRFSASPRIAERLQSIAEGDDVSRLRQAARDSLGR